MRESGFTSIKEKIQIVSEVIAGEKIQPVARKHRVSRPSVYSWTKKALDALQEALKPGNRGPKLKKGILDTKDNLIEEKKEKIEELSFIIQEKEKQTKNLREKLHLQKKSLPRPSRCPHCGFEKIYKNGTYKVKPERLAKVLQKNGREIEIIIQQFICPYCRSSVSTPEKERKIVLF